MGIRRSMIWLVCLGLLSVLAPARADGNYPSLRQSHDPTLQKLLDSAIARLHLQSPARKQDLAVALVDMRDPARPRVADVNGDEMMYAASLPKIGILLAAFVEIQRGSMQFSSRLRQSLTDMIRFSSNEAATRVMNLVGKNRVNEILASAPYRLYDPAANGGLWVGKEYGKSPAFRRDPLHHISHGATAMQVARFYYMLETGQLLPPTLTASMKEILSHPGIKHKFVKGLTGRDVTLFRKSGTWHEWHADSALVETPEGNYILVGLVQDTRGGDWLAQLAPAVDDLLHPQRVASSRGPTAPVAR